MLSALSLWALGGCVPEDNGACGKNQVYESKDGIIPYAVCVCDASKGYVFDTQRGYGCTRCDDDQVPENGRCTSQAAETDGGAQDASMSEPEPTGVGEPCQSADDCESFDAKYCAPSGLCLVDNCESGENSCGSGTTCCDYSAFLAGFSLCLMDGELVDDDCPMGGIKVEP